MARPQKNNLDYFRHERNMKNDHKLRAVRARFNNFEGYAIYCMMLECLCDQDDLKIPYDDIHLELLSGDFGTTSERLKEVLEYFFKINLMQLNDNHITCDQLIEKHFDVVEKRSKNRVSVAEMIVSATETHVSATKTELPSRVNINKIKEKKNKVNKIKENEISDIDFAYNSYPSRCPINGRSTGKCSKNKDKIAKLISDGVDVKSAIEWYVKDCKKTNTYLKNFATFLNNIPEMSTDNEQQAVQSQPMKLNRTPLHLVKFKPYPKVEDDWTDEEFQEWSRKEQERIKEMCSVKSGGANV